MAPQRLGQQRPGHGRVVQGRRVELDELDVGHRHAGPQGHGHPVAGGLGRVGGHGEELAGAPGGQHHVARPAPRRPRPPGGRASTPRQRPPSTSRSRANHRSSTGAGRRPGGLHQRPLHLGTGGRPAGVDDPGPRVAALAGQGQAPRGLPVELGPHGDELVAPGPAPRRPAPGRRRRRTARPRRPGCRPGAGRSSPRRPPSTAATPPWAQRVADWESSPLVSTPTRSGRTVPGCGQPDGGRQAGHAAAQHQDVEGSGGVPGAAGAPASGRAHAGPIDAPARRPGGPRPRR